MNECAIACYKNKKACKEKKCRLWIDYKKDLNCTMIAASKHCDGMTLQEVAKRLNLSIVRIKQIQDAAIQKIQKISHLKR